MSENIQLKKEELRQILRDKLEELQFLEWVEIEEIMNMVDIVPPEAIEEILEVVAEGKRKQDEFLKVAIQEDKDFLPNLKKELENYYDEIKKLETAEEQAKAEKLIEKIEDLDTL